MVNLVEPPFDGRLNRLDLCSFRSVSVIPHRFVYNVATVGPRVFIDGSYDRDDPTQETFWQHVDEIVEGEIVPLPHGDDTTWYLGGTTADGSVLLIDTRTSVATYEPASGRVDELLDLRPVYPESQLLDVWVDEEQRIFQLVKRGGGMEIAVHHPGVAALERSFLSSGPGGSIAQGEGPLVAATVLDQGSNGPGPPRVFLLEPSTLAVTAEHEGWSGLVWSKSGDWLLLSRGDGMLGRVTAEDWTKVELLGNPGMGQIIAAAWPA